MSAAPPLAEPSAGPALDALAAGFAALAEAPLDPADPAAANDLIHRFEQIGRMADAARSRVLTTIDDGAFHLPDGHRAAHVMVGHTGHLSEQEAKRRAKAMRALRDLPAVESAYAAGAIGLCQVNLIARVHANSRVTTRFVALDSQIALLAARLPYEELDRRLTNWMRATDEDGTADRSRRSNENRRARMTSDFDGGWDLLAGFGSLDGARNHEILRVFTEAEFAQDWAEAKATHGEAITVDHLARTPDQRAADALTRIFTLAADFWATTAGGCRIDLDVVVDQETLERHLLRNAGVAVPQREDLDLGPLPDDPAADPTEGAGDDLLPFNPTVDPTGDQPAPAYQAAPRCETLAGCPLDPSEVAAHALIGRLRRVVYDARGVVIDLSEVGSLFSGSARLAVLLERRTCYWPGCTQPLDHCQVDHLRPRRAGGRTNPENGAPLCGRHNRHKELGYVVRRDEEGRPRVYRPDGTLLEDWA